VGERLAGTGGFVLDQPHEIEYYQFLVRRGALRLEMRGLKRRGRSAYSIIKQVYGLHGSREKVLAWMDRVVEEVNYAIAQDRSRRIEEANRSRNG
jgi:hypothetical protein